MVGSMLNGDPVTWTRLTLQFSSLWGGKAQFDVMAHREAPPANASAENLKNVRYIQPADAGRDVSRLRELRCARLPVAALEKVGA